MTPTKGKTVELDPITIKVPNDLVQIWADIDEDPVWEGTVDEFGHLLRHIQGLTKTTYRIVCPNFGTWGHRTHEHTKATLEKAIERAEGNDELYQKLADKEGPVEDRYYRAEIGWKVEARIETDWETVA